MEYWDVVGRNIGIFTRDQQERLRTSKVTLAGVGGVGGIEAATLARFGVGELSIIDPGVFDAPDMNRQYGAMASTIGQNKARVMADLLRDINPFLRVHVMDHVVTDRQQLVAFTQGSALVIDAIDFMGFPYKVQFAEIARELEVYNLTAPIFGFSMLMMIFDPDGMMLEEFYRAPSDRRQWERYRLPLAEILGPRRHGNLNQEFLEGRRPYGSTCAGAAALNGGLVATEAALILTGVRRKEDVVVVPRVTYVDMLRRMYEVYQP